MSLKRRVVSGKFLALGQLENFSRNESRFSHCQREPEEHCASKSHQHSWSVVNLWVCFGVMSYLSLDPQSRAVSQPHTRKMGLF